MNRAGIHYPGNIAYTGERGYFPGCALKYFESVAALNEYFDQAFNQADPYALVDWKPAPDGVGIYAFFTKQLSPEQMRDMEEFSKDWEVYKRKRDAERAEQKAKADEVRIAAEAELKRLQQVGAHCEQEHKHLIKAAREEKKGKKK